MTVTFPEITIGMAGCWLDGRWGWHNGYRVVERAHEFGFTIPAEYMPAMRHYWDNGQGVSFQATAELWDPINGQGELADQATDFLQERAPEGYQFVWDMGEFLLLTDEEASYV